MSDEPQHGHLDDDLWSWIDQDEDDGDLPEVDPASVTAVMVVHGADEWLPRQLLSLAGLSPRPGRLVAVDTGSSESARGLLRRELDEGVLDEHFVYSDGSTQQRIWHLKYLGDGRYSGHADDVVGQAQGQIQPQHAHHKAQAQRRHQPALARAVVAPGAGGGPQALAVPMP